jgi:hypothetical protein
MHYDSDESPGPQGPLRRRAPFDVTPNLPTPGRWKLLHGDVAQALVKLARDLGQMVAEGPGLDLPAGFPKPVAAGVWWRMPLEERSFLVREDPNGEFLSCYVYGA